MIALIEAKRAGLLKQPHWLPNILSGVIVGIVALPLAIAFAIASGAKPEQGIYTAIVAGFVSTLFGGSRLQISGPTGAFIVILSGITAKYGMTGLQIATLLAGGMLLLMGLLRFGAVIRFIPEPVIVGFTAGIGVIIWVGQWKDFFGLPNVPLPHHFHEKVWVLLQLLPKLEPSALLLSMIALSILVVGPKFLQRISLLRRVPTPLLAMLTVTIIQATLALKGVSTIGSQFGGIPTGLPQPAWLPVTFSDVIPLIGPAFTIALLGAIESLLSAVVADSMSNTHHDSNQELIGQGLANLLSPLFGGFATTGAIARTATNIRNGATGPLSGVVHAVVLMLVLLFLAPLAAHIPLCALAAILFVVAYNMSELPKCVYLLKTAPKADVAVLVVTFLLTVFADLVVAVNIGVVLAALLFMKRMSETVNVTPMATTGLARWQAIIEQQNVARPTTEQTMIGMSIDGPLFFGVTERLLRTLEPMYVENGCLMLNFERVPMIDASGLQALWEIIDHCKQHHMPLWIVQVRPNIQAKLMRAGIADVIGQQHVVGFVE